MSKLIYSTAVGQDYGSPSAGALKVAYRKTTHTSESRPISHTVTLSTELGSLSVYSKDEILDLADILVEVSAYIKSQRTEDHPQRSQE